LDFGDSGFSADLLWAGSWEYEGSLINRGDLRLHANQLGLTLRTQVLDKRPAPPSDKIGEGFTAGKTDFSGGLYHDPTGSRLLYGILNVRGLPARVTKPWNRGAPFAENRQASLRDLKTEPSSTGEQEAYLYLRLPWLDLPRKTSIRGFSSVGLNGDMTPAYSGGAEVQFSKKRSLGLEGFYTGYTLAPREGSSWFSETPPLPERDFRFWAANLFFTSPRFGISTDWGYSRTFAYGEDLYGNMALRIGDRPWRVSLAVDAAGNRYVGRDGAAAGPGFRTAARIDRRGGKNSLLRFSAVLRAPGMGETFDKISGLLSYRFPGSSGKAPISLSRISLSLNRDLSEQETIPESLEGLLGLNLWKLRFTLRGSPAGTASGEASYNVGIFRFRFTLGYTGQLWDGSFTLALQGKPGRLSLKIASADLGRDWSYGLSWRLRI
jgi:hypothetical protein